MDKDADGKISVGDVPTILRVYGCTPTEAELGNIQSELAREGVKEIDFNKSLQIALPYFKGDNENDLKAAFKVFDRDGSGITVTEFKHYLTSIGDKLTEAEFEEFAAQADPAKKGRITMDGFLKALSNKAG